MKDASADLDPTVRAMRLRADPPKPLRLSRKVAMAGAAGLVAAVSTAAGFGLVKTSKETPSVELVPSRAPRPEAVRALPGDYAAPRLGPPLPGDLGKPVLNARNAAEARPGATASAGPDAHRAEVRRAEGERRRVEAEAARGSPLLLIQNGSINSDSARGSPGGPPEVKVDRRADAATDATLLAGSVLEASLVTGIRSDLEGPVLGQITADVHDTLTGRDLLIPKGSRLIGSHASDVSQGQTRLTVRWTRIILPNGRSIALEDEAASDARGYAGLEDRTDQRWSERLRAAALTTLLAVSGAAVDVDDADRVARALRDGTGRGMDALGRGLVERGLSIPPRITIRPGFAFRIILTQDLNLQPYGD
ncbi:TrbI/VirB10 family protein [Brevundimonas sp. CEF1]|uniref:TrbI/VirB10 family protein n=1 Tax=Brevundimonas sp. CEF1 TaxID=3442642 RepID=UPI003F513276